MCHVILSKDGIPEEEIRKAHWMMFQVFVELFVYLMISLIFIVPLVVAPINSSIILVLVALFAIDSFICYRYIKMFQRARQHKALFVASQITETTPA